MTYSKQLQHSRSSLPKSVAFNKQGVINEKKREKSSFSSRVYCCSQHVEENTVRDRDKPY